ncbi:MAG: putrescine transport system substrate-binding protein, partial [Paracoccaceae bacterium]
GNAASLPLVDPEISGDTGIFPTDGAKAKGWIAVVYGSKIDRIINRAWTTVKTGR